MIQSLLDKHKRLKVVLALLNYGAAYRGGGRPGGMLLATVAEP